VNTWAVDNIEQLFPTQELRPIKNNPSIQSNKSAQLNNKLDKMIKNFLMKDRNKKNNNAPTRERYRYKRRMSTISPHRKKS